MFVKITTSGPRKYVKLVESYRDSAGVSRQRVVATLGRLESVAAGEASPLINGLLRAAGQPTLEQGTGEVAFAPARSVGDTWLLHALWQQLGLETAFRRILRPHRQFDAERLLRVMVFNRLCDPDSKLGVLRWLEGSQVPGVEASEVTHQRLLRTMDTLSEQAERLAEALSGLLRPLIDQTLSVVFYDLTTIRAEGASTPAGELRRYGRSKDGGTAQQVLLGVVQTAEGLPIHHEVFAGNAAETQTLLPTIEKVLARYPIRRVVLVADRGLLSLDNIEALSALRVGEQPLEFILAVPGRRYVEFDTLLADFHESRCVSAQEEVTEVFDWQGHRLIVAHDPARAAESCARRETAIAALEAEAERLAGKLDGQDSGARYRGRKLSDSGVKARFYHAVREAHLSHIVRVDLSAAAFVYDIDSDALARTRRLDGKLLLVTNVPDHPPADIVARYKALADIERGFRVLKNEIEIAPVYHRLPDRIRAHALICFLALILYRVLRTRLKARNSPLSPERGLEIARRVQWHQATLHRQQTVSGLSTLTPQQRELFETLELPTPRMASL